MPIRPVYIPLVGGLALVPIVVYLLAKPEFGAILSAVSTVLIVLTLLFMFREEGEERGTVYGTPP